MARKKTLLQKAIALTFGVAIGGFGWLAIKNFADLFMDYTPTQQLTIGIIGFLAIGWIIQNFKIKILKPLG